LKLQIKIDGKTYKAEVEVLDEVESQETYPPYPPVVSTAQPMASPVAHVPAHSAEEHTANDKQYCSPLAALVIRVNVTPGQEIQPNDVILVLEAMKMETSITAHGSGRVKCIHVAPGDPVKAHQVLIEVE
jgi:methylmalonyl-CoA carboxyltransferase small subunit